MKEKTFDVLDRELYNNAVKNTVQLRALIGCLGKKGLVSVDEIRKEIESQGLLDTINEVVSTHNSIQ